MFSLVKKDCESTFLLKNISLENSFFRHTREVPEVLEALFIALGLFVHSETKFFFTMKEEEMCVN